MSLSSNKKKGRSNINNKFSRNRGSAEKTMASDGVYSNSRLMHAAASLVGCIVQVQVRNGSMYEGIFRTFSNEFDMVLEMPHKIDQKLTPAKGIGPAVSNLLVSFPFEDSIADKLIFRLKDIVMLQASNVDLDFAVKDNFTDTAISKFNGIVAERELEPWEGPSGDTESIGGALGVEEEDDANGWDPNDMFRLNAEKYGVKSSYDNSLQEYTVPLTKKNTDEYRKQEAKAMKIAQEIESNTSYQSHIQLENGDEEDRFSAVVRSENSNPNRYLPPQRRKNIPGPKRPGTLPSALSVSAPKPYPVQPAISSPSMASSQGFKSPLAPCPAKQSPSPPVQTAILSPSAAVLTPGANSMPVPKEMADRIANGDEMERENVKPMISAPVPEHVPPMNVSVKPHVLGSTMPQPLPPRPDRRREGDRKGSKHKGRDDEIEEFKKFSSNFKLSDESKELKEDKDSCLTNIETVDESPLLCSKVADLKVSEKNDDDATPDIVKTSKLNPNAKEFVLNPNAKSFTPRSMSVTSPPSQQQQQQIQQMLPQRMHTQSPVMAMPHAQMMQGMGQPVFATMSPQYVMQATPVSMALTSPFAASLQQPPRIRKVQIMPRHEISPSLHVAAATGQPILAPNHIHNPSQLTMQYTPPPGMIHAPGPPQQTMAYPQMSYVLGPRVMSPQPVGMVPTSHTVSYCDSAHLNAHVFMPAHPSAAALSAVSAAHSMQQGAGGQHSNPHPPQSHTPVMHPSPSPVHQQAPQSHVNQSQPPTPTTVMYPGQMSQHHPLQSSHHNHNQTMNAHVAHHANFATGPQPVVLMQQQASHSHHPGALTTGPHPLHLHSLHGQNPTGQVIPQMTVIPTSTTMVSAPNSMVTPPFVPHHQGGFLKL